jgi:hypothetical protein
MGDYVQQVLMHSYFLTVCTSLDVDQNVTVKSMISAWLPHYSKSFLFMVDPAYLRKLLRFRDIAAETLDVASLSIQPLSSPPVLTVESES